MSLAKAWSLTVVLVAAAIGPRGTFAQGGYSTTTCISSFDWMNNNLGQNPCLVSSYLVSECLGYTINVNPLPSPSSQYGIYAINDCQCSTVTYSMIGACAICQNATVESWSVWSAECSGSMTHYKVFPMNIPNGTAVPHWAYLDVVTDDIFNVTAAQRAGDSPEVTSTNVLQSTSSIVLTVTSVFVYSSAASTSTESSTAQSTSKSSNVGVIAGGVIGGIAGITIVGVAAWFFVRRSRSTKAQQSAALRGGAVLESVDMTQQFRLYDPSDPSTFPTSPPSGVIPSTSSTVDNVYQRPSIPSRVSFEQPRSGGMYTGAPEL